MARIFFAALFVIIAGTAAAFDFPLKTTNVAFFVDHDPRPGFARDFAGGTQTYDYGGGLAHKGTDFRAAQGAIVRAAESGRVVFVRDGEPDGAFIRMAKRIGMEAAARAFMAGGAAGGNVVIVQHSNGLHSIYAHLAERTINVRKGDHIAGGVALGRVGLSGMTNFSHLHFEVRTKRGRVIDPYAVGLFPA